MASARRQDTVGGRRRTPDASSACLNSPAPPEHSATQPSGSWLVHSVFNNPEDAPTGRQAFPRYEVLYVLHGDSASEWPIPIDLGLAVTGFRRATGLSQVAFADALGQSRGTVERWETGRARPFRGQTHRLLTALRPLAADQTSAGQLLGVAAHALCPALTRPAGTYTRAGLAALLTGPGHSHADLAPALINVLVEAQILVELDPADTGPSAGLVPRAGIAVLDRRAGRWDVKAVAVVSKLSDDDAQLWLSLGSRLVSDSAARRGRQAVA